MSTEELQAAEAAPAEVGSGSAPEEMAEDQADKVQFDDAQQEKLNEIVGGVRMKARSESQELKARNDALENRLRQLEAQQPAQNGPPPVRAKPDKYSDSYEQELAAWESDLVERTRWESQQEAAQREAQTRERMRHEQEAMALQQRGNDFAKRAREMGMTEQEQSQAVQQIVSAGVNEAILMEVLDAPNGPAILRGLASDPNRLIDVAEKSNQGQRGLIDAAIEVRSLSNSLPQNAAPRPPDMLQGTGVPKQKRGPRGLTIE